MNENDEQPRIATTSFVDGLDFACNLLVAGVEGEVALRAERASELLGILTHYISFRWAGEELLALQKLEDLSACIGADVSYCREQLEAQLRWCARSLGLE